MIELIIFIAGLFIGVVVGYNVAKDKEEEYE